MSLEDTVRRIAESVQNTRSAGDALTRLLDQVTQDNQTLRMEDKDARRLDDRIDAQNRESILRIEALARESQARHEAFSREGQLRLDGAMARVDGQFATISSALAELKSGQADLKSDLKSEMAETRATSRTWGMWAAGTALAAGLGIGALLIGMKQVWIGGVQVGQSISTSQATNPQSSIVATPTNKP